MCRWSARRALAGGLDKLVNELQGEEFEVGVPFGERPFLTHQAWVEKCMEVGTDEHGWMVSDHIIGVVSKTARAL